MIFSKQPTWNHDSSAQSAEAANPPLDSEEPLAKKNTGETELKPQIKKAKPSYMLRVLCLALHTGLILFHLGLLVVWATRLEHKMVFSAELQKKISEATKTAMMGFATKLANRWNITRFTTLTATHDNLMSWSGLGSAVNNLYLQLSVPASITGTFSIAGYLGLTTLVHVTTPALISVVTFNLSTSSVAPTVGVPQWNESNHDLVSSFMGHTLPFLTWIQSLDDTIGLFNGSLYDVLQDVDLESGSADVSAIGFNITCGYLPGTNTDILENGKMWKISLEAPFRWGDFDSTGPNIIQIYCPQHPTNNSIVLYTPNDVVDSHGQRGSPVTLKKPMGPNATISQLQFLQCSKSLVHQRGTVNTRSRKLDPSSLQPSIYKTHSNWQRYDESLSLSADDTLIGSNMWSDYLNCGGDWVYIPMNDNRTTSINYATSFELYLMEQLGLDPSWISSKTASTSNSILELHNIENSLSALVAAMFWMAGHITPESIQLKYDSNGTIVPPTSFTNSTVIQQSSTYCRLDINIIFLAIGMGASVLLFLLVIPYWIVATYKDEIGNIGLLHAIWLFRHHPQLEHLLPQVPHPTDRNLRLAGLVRAQVCLTTPDFPITRSMRKGHPKEHAEDNYHRIGLCPLLKKHSISFPIGSQGRMTSLITAVTTGLGTVYLAGLIFLVQRITIQRSLQSEETLTATHDNIVAWSGLGSALATVYQQFSIPASVKRSVLISGYLTVILVLHLTTPLLFSIEAYSPSTMLNIHTNGVPEFNTSASLNSLDFVYNNMPFLPWIGNLQESEKLGLLSGSLYDTLESFTPDSMPAQVHGVGFNISCGYLSGENTKVVSTSDGYIIEQNGTEVNMTDHTSWEIVLPSVSSQGFWLDPSDRIPIKLQHPMGPNLTIFHLQFMLCTKSLVNQTGIIDTQTGRLDGTLEPSIQKNDSTWQEYKNIPHLLGKIPDLLRAMCDIPLANDQDGISRNFLGQGDIYLMDELGLDPAWLTSGVDLTSGSVLNLHDIENALANLVASMFWIGKFSGHIQQPSLIQKYSINNVPNLSILAVSLGLGASIILCALAIISCHGPNSSTGVFNGIGMLHAFWLFRNHPGLVDQLKQMEEPTTDDLRAAGMIRVRLLGDSKVSVESE
ncbi:hypothetical protein B0H13DRAFT_1863125 [Mycena leptocephala]|nr:hypothetical protein B0H13DRAFT_1863125 [Mycena leptocephala]